MPLRNQITCAGLEELSIKIHRLVSFGLCLRPNPERSEQRTDQPETAQHPVRQPPKITPAKAAEIRRPMDVAATKRPREHLSGCPTHKKRVANGVSPGRPLEVLSEQPDLDRILEGREKTSPSRVVVEHPCRLCRRRLESTHADAAPNRRLDRVRSRVDNSGVLAAHPSASRTVAFTPTITVQDSRARLGRHVGASGRDHSPLARRLAL